MLRIKGTKDLPKAKRGALIKVNKTNNIFNRQLVKRYYYNKKIVINMLKRVGEAEKENIDLLSL